MLSTAKTHPESRQLLRFWPCALSFAFFWTTLVNTIAQKPASPPPDHALRMTRGLASFQRDISALLREHCLKCHGGEKVKGGLDLATREGLLKGGDEGSAVVPFDAKASRMLKLVRHEEEPHMPDRAPKLAPEAITQLAAWIDDGAPYDKPLIDGKKPARDKSQVSDEDRQWWAFQPLGKIAPPPGPKDQAIPKHPVDAFIAAKAAPQGLKLAPIADKRVLIRRAYLDLIGIPPTPEEVDAFLTDKSPKAWERVIDHLLDSPRHGERWARHWLDVARFAESTGFEHDYNRPGAYHYRDFVIKALNSDLPYDQFVRWQLAGDEFEPENPLALSATGFLGAGVFPTQITANEVERTRYDALDDMLSTTSQAFLGLTTGCARCHDHKFDPIPVKDYYRMLATFTTTTRAVVDLDLEPQKTARLLAEWDTGRVKLADELSRHETSLKPAFTRWLAEGASLLAGPRWSPLVLTNLASKAGATFKPLPDDSYLVEGKNGDREEYTFTGGTGLQNVTALRLDALSDPSMKKGGPGRADNGNFALSRLRVRVKSAGKSEAVEVAIARAEADFEQNKDNLSVASSLDDKGNTGWAIDPQFGKDHSAMFVFAKPLTLATDEQLVVSLEFQINTRHNIGRPRLAITDDPQPALPGELLPSQVLALLRNATRPGFASTLSSSDRETLFNWWKLKDAGQRERAAKLAEHLQKKPDGKTKVLICAEGYEPLRHHTQGADFFTNTFYLKRGNSDLKDGVAEAGFLQVLMRGTNTASQWNWQPPAGAKFSGRRRAFANWLTDTESGAGALAARVAVNRLWQHHFGRGIVTTPNDFGRTGALPSHPELLDWLAGELVREGWQLKPLHKLLMTSATYMQAAASSVPGGSDQGVSLFIGHHPRRLEGESIRDSMLAVSGKLDTTMFGPGSQDERSLRRSIYFTIKRSELIGSMVVFDQPEPLASQGQRPTTTVAPQALFLLNGAPVREWAEALAKAIGAKANPALQINRAYLRALSRPPTKIELTAAMEFLKSQNSNYSATGKSDGWQPALADFCQILFALNEFAYVN